MRDYLAEQEQAARAAVARAFAGARKSGTVRREAGSARRPPAEMEQLAERLYAAVRTHPGETMTVIAAQVGEKPRSLHRPMFHLKRAGRVRSAGQRHHTRYFPMTTAKGA